MVFSWLARTDPKDVARVESKTVIVTKNQRDTIPIPADGAKSQLGSWMSESDWQRAREERFPGCMAGRCHGVSEASKDQPRGLESSVFRVPIISLRFRSNPDFILFYFEGVI